MKRVLAILLCAVMLFSLCSCNVEKEVNDALEKAAQEANKKIIHGSISANTYSSDYTGITFNKPTSWKYSSDEELASFAESISSNTDYSSSFEKTVTENGNVYEMMVKDSSTGSGAFIIYENLEITNGSSISEEEYLDIVKSQMEGVSQAEYSFEESSEIKLCGEKYLKGVFTAVSSGVEFEQVYYLRNIDGIMTVMVATLIGDYTTADFEAMFR